MFFPSDLAHITMRDLSRNPGRALKRVMRGERLIVTRHGHPVGTLQPLNGCVTQPFEAQEYDLKGSLAEDLDQEIARLSPLEKKILMDGVRWDRLWLSRIPDGGCFAVLEDWELRGLARRTPRGRVLTGRSMLLREALLERVGLRERLYE